MRMGLKAGRCFCISTRGLVAALLVVLDLTVVGLLGGGGGGAGRSASMLGWLCRWCKCPGIIIFGLLELKLGLVAMSLLVTDFVFAPREGFVAGLQVHEVEDEEEVVLVEISLELVVLRIVSLGPWQVHSKALQLFFPTVASIISGFLPPLLDDDVWNLGEESTPTVPIC